jgi:hypothetical protein
MKSVRNCYLADISGNLLVLFYLTQFSVIRVQSKMKYYVSTFNRGLLGFFPSLSVQFFGSYLYFRQ